MWDLEYLQEPALFDGLFLYFYRSGINKGRVVHQLNRFAGSKGGFLEFCKLDELKNAWVGSALFEGGIRICDLGELRTGIDYDEPSLITLLHLEPGVPTALLIPVGDKMPAWEPPAGIVCIEEPVVSDATISKLLTLMVAGSDLAVPTSLLADRSFQDHFLRWIEEHGTAELPELLQEFDTSILVYLDRDKHTFSAPLDTTPPEEGPAFTVRALTRFLSAPGTRECIGLLRMIRLKQLRGWNEVDLTRDLWRAVSRVHDQVQKHSAVVGPSTLERTPTRSSVILWTALTLMTDRPRETEDGAFPEEADGNFLLRFFEECGEFRRRVKDLQNDPLKGSWRLLASALTPPLLENSRMGQTLLKSMLVVHLDGEPMWLNTLRAILSACETGGTGAPHFDHQPALLERELPRSVSEFVGNSRIVEALDRRWKLNNHKRPLTLTGPTGIGKQSLCQLYAKALFCEARSDFGFCNRCSSCKNFAAGALREYLWFDGGRPDIVAKIREALPLLRFESWMPHRVVVLADADKTVAGVDALLKHMEDGTPDTTYILLSSNAKPLPTTVLSRSDVFELEPLDVDKSMRLTSTWLQGETVNPRVCKIIALAGKGLPGEILRLCKAVRSASAITVEQARVCCGVTWGQSAINYWKAILNGASPSHSFPPNRENSMQMASHMRSVLVHLREGSAPEVAALVGLEDEVRELRRALDRQAHIHGATSDLMWSRLAEHWVKSECPDAESFSAAMISAHLIASGTARRRDSLN